MVWVDQELLNSVHQLNSKDVIFSQSRYPRVLVFTQLQRGTDSKEIDGMGGCRSKNAPTRVHMDKPQLSLPLWQVERCKELSVVFVLRVSSQYNFRRLTQGPASKPAWVMGSSMEWFDQPRRLVRALCNKRNRRLKIYIKSKRKNINWILLYTKQYK